MNQGVPHRQTWAELGPLLARYPRFIKEAVEQNYPFVPSDLRRHERWLDFVNVSDNCEVEWTEAVIEEFAERWDWKTLSLTVFVHSETFLSDALVARYRERWEPWALSVRDGTYDPDEDEWDPTDTDINEGKQQAGHGPPESSTAIMPLAVPLGFSLDDLTEGAWTEARVGTIQSRSAFQELSVNTNVEWSIDLIYRYEDKWDWGRLASNSGVWQKVLEPYSDMLLPMLEAIDFTADPPVVPFMEAAIRGQLPAGAQAKIDQVKSLFGPGARVAGVRLPERPCGLP